MGYGEMWVTSRDYTHEYSEHEASISVYCGKGELYFKSGGQHGIIIVMDADGN